MDWRTSCFGNPLKSVGKMNDTIYLGFFNLRNLMIIYMDEPCLRLTSERRLNEGYRSPYGSLNVQIVPKFPFVSLRLDGACICCSMYHTYGAQHTIVTDTVRRVLHCSFVTSSHSSILIIEKAIVSSNHHLLY